MIPLVFRYFGRSRVERGANAYAVTFAPNLSRPPVSFDAELAQPLRFREAISALHHVVISDLRFQPKDHTAYRQWLKRQAGEEQRVRAMAFAQARDERLAHVGKMPPELPAQFKTMHRIYWKARRSYADYLQRHDPALFRRLMPCDPVITVAPDVVFFECFSADESSYGCLTVERDAMFKGASSIQPGTTNVDYSWALFDHFQTLRTYRPTRFHVDPSGFEVRTTGAGEIREEKIELPESWLRGFLQIQAGMTLPMRKVTLDRESLYSILAFLKRHKAKLSPRALRFDLAPGQPPAIE
ncbi:MAG TPA: SWIM zinc finger family protein, partial [Planctomycetota bacterium]|nr:SWIM zinc finger family protein [Planctomycetota bacterium]